HGVVGLRDDRRGGARRIDRGVRARAGQQHPRDQVALPMRAAILALAILIATALPARATTLHVLPGSGDRIVVSYEDGLESAAERLRDAAEDSLTRISADLPDLAKPRVIHIQLVRDASSIADVAPGGRGAPQYAVGVTYPDLGVVTVAMRRGAQIVDPIETLDHEL